MTANTPKGGYCPPTIMVYEIRTEYLQTTVASIDGIGISDADVIDA